MSACRSEPPEEPLPSQPGAAQCARVLVVDDSAPMREMIANALDQNGFHPVLASDGDSALEIIATETLDVVVSDIRMPGRDGIALLEAVKQAEPDLPVILLTGAPDLATAIKAVELGAFRYLTKPFSLVDLCDAVGRAHQLGRLGRARRQAASLAARDESDKLRERMGSQLDEALDGVAMAYQPLVAVEDRRVLGYEAFLRSTSTALRAPAEILEVAERLERLPDVGRRVRNAVIDTMGKNPVDGWTLFTNVHPLELLDEELLDPAAPIAARANRVVLEVTERAAIDRIDRLAERVTRLRALGFRLAVDLGAGYASLNSFAQLQPDYVKLDMALVHNAPVDPMRRRLIRSMIQVCDELDIAVVGEGVETPEQRDTLLRLGCRVMQGYLFARPAASLPEVRW